jgi:hypothetical protein
MAASLEDRFMTRFTIATMFTAALFTFTTAACKKKDDSGSGKAAKTAEGGKAAATKLPKLGLQIDVPGEVNVADAIMGEGNMIQGASVGAMQVEIFKEPQTIDQAKEDAEAFTPKNEKAETLPDGWALSYENTGSMGKNYFVTVRRDLGGKTYKCWVTTGDASQGAAVLSACKTLRQ